MMNETTEHIFTTFQRLALIHGLKKVTMEMVATECGISKKTIYKYFSSKDEIIQMLIDSVVERVKYEISSIQQRTSNPYDRMISFFEIIFEIIRNVPDTVMYDAGRYYPAIARKIQYLKDEYSSFVIRTIRQGIEEGLFKDINPVFVERFYMGAVDSVFSEEFMKNSGLTINDQISSFRTMLFSGLLKDGKDDLAREEAG